MPEYGDHAYWEKRYQTDKTKVFDWLQSYAALKHILEKICNKDSKILMLGCGNALISEEMYVDGYHNIFNIDISSAVIDQMKERNATYKGMIYEVMDCTDLKYENSFFDIVIDKSTIDALLCGADPDITVAKMTKETQRVLKNSGVYCAISYGIPETRICHLKLPHLSFDIETIEVSKPEDNSKNISTHFVYLCVKNLDADKVCEDNWAFVLKELTEEEKTELVQTTFQIQYQKELNKNCVDDKYYEQSEDELSEDMDFLGKMAVGDFDVDNIKECLEKFNDESEAICSI